MPDAIRLIVNGEPRPLPSVDEIKTFHPIDFSQPLTCKAQLEVYDQWKAVVQLRPIHDNDIGRFISPALNCYRDKNFYNYEYQNQGDKLFRHLDFGRNEQHFFWDFLNKDGTRSVRNFSVTEHPKVYIREDAAGKRSIVQEYTLFENGQTCMTRRFSDLAEYRCITPDELESTPLEEKSNHYGFQDLVLGIAFIAVLKIAHKIFRQHVPVST